MNDVLNAPLDGHLAALCLRFGLSWRGVGRTLIAFSLVGPTIVVLAGVDVTLGHVELPIFDQPGKPGIERIFPHLRTVVASTRHRGRDVDTCCVIWRLSIRSAQLEPSHHRPMIRPLLVLLLPGLLGDGGYVDLPGSHRLHRLD